MKFVAAVGAVLAVALGAVLVVRASRSEPAPDAPEAKWVESPPVEAAPRPAPSNPVFPPGSASESAYFAGLAFQDLKADAAREESVRLAARLLENPDLWAEAWEGLVLLDQVKHAVAVLAEMPEVLGDPRGEAWLTDRLKSAETVKERRIAARALALSSTLASLEGLKGAAGNDAEAQVRLDALYALRRRQMNLDPGMERDAVVAFFTARAEADPNPRVKAFAARMVAEPEAVTPEKRPSTGQRLKQKVHRQLQEKE